MYRTGRWGRSHLSVGYLSLFTAIFVLPAQAEAQSAASREEAKRLAAQGSDALRRKDYSSAEAWFRSADALVHSPTLGVDHARALVGLGKLVEGHERYAQVLREGVAANAPWQWHMALVNAEAEFAAVERRLAWLTITVKDAKNPEVEIDDRPVPDAAQGVRRATNPGDRVVSVSAPGYLPVQRQIALKEGQAAELALTLERDPSAAPAPIERPNAHPVVVIGPRPPATAPNRTLPIALLSAGGAALAAGAITGFLALNVRAELRGTCTGDVCVPDSDNEYADYRGKRDRYRALGTASGVAFAVGAGAVVSGAALLLFTGQPTKSDAGADETRATHASLQLGPSAFSLAVTHFF